MNPENQSTPTQVPEPAPELVPLPTLDAVPTVATTQTQSFTAQPGISSVASNGGKDKNFIVALLLSIFLGSIGVDRFYLGNIGLGVLKLLTGGVFGILYIIDIILIATKKIKGVNWVE